MPVVGGGCVPRWWLGRWRHATSRETTLVQFCLGLIFFCWHLATQRAKQTTVAQFCLDESSSMVAYLHRASQSAPMYKVLTVWQLVLLLKIASVLN